MTNQILDDLKLNFQDRMKNATKDFIALCKTGGVDESDCAASVIAMLVSAGAGAIGLGTIMTPDEAAAMFKRGVIEAQAQRDTLIATLPQEQRDAVAAAMASATAASAAQQQPAAPATTPAEPVALAEISTSVNDDVSPLLKEKVTRFKEVMQERTSAFVQSCEMDNIPQRDWLPAIMCALLEGTATAIGTGSTMPPQMAGDMLKDAVEVVRKHKDALLMAAASQQPEAA